MSLLEELIHRNGLRVALGGRDDKSLESITDFLVAQIKKPAFAPLLIDVANVMLGM